MLEGILLAAALTAASTPAPTVGPVPATPIFRTYSMADGLPTGDVYTVTQDHDGYIWIGTHAGLVRYDSRTFRVFRHDPGQPASLPANDVSAVLVARDGSLWAGGEGTGLNRFEPKTGGFLHWLHDPHRADSLSGNDVMAIAQDRAGAIWVGVYAGGLNKLDARGASFSHLRHRKGDSASLVSDNITALAPATDGGLWIGTDAGVEHLDARGQLHPITLPAKQPGPTVWQLRAAGDGVDAATTAGLFHVDATGNATQIGPAALSSLRGPNGELWVGRRGGLELIDARGNRHTYAPIEALRGSLPGQLPADLFRDYEGGLWVALVDGGVAYLPPTWQALSVYRHIPGDPASLTSDRVRSLALAPDGSLWASGTGMLDRINPVSREVTHTKIPGLAGTSLTRLAADRTGRLWIGTHRGLFTWDGKRLRQVSDPGGLLQHGVWRLLAARDGTIYGTGVGTGAFRVRPGANELEALGAPEAGEAALAIHQMAEAPDGSVWEASLAGLARMAPNGDAFRFVPGVARGNVLAFDIGPTDDNLWIARGTRLEHYHLHDGGATRTLAVGRAEGWPDTSVFGLTVGPDGRVFALGARNLLTWDPGLHQLHTFPLGQVFSLPDITGNALVDADHGQLFAASLAGIVGIRVDALPHHLEAPRIVLDEVSVRRDGRTTPLDPADPIDLGWDDRELTVAAQVLSFVNPDHNQYRFRLAGFDPGWVTTDTRNIREFSVLDPGSYRLLVSGRTANGPWSAPLAAIQLHVAAAPWDTPWARAGYALVVLLLAAVTVWLLRRRIRHQHRLAFSEERQHMAEQANNAKSHFLATMAHEIRTPLTGVLGMTELLLNTRLDERQHQYADAIRRSGSLLLRQVNDALDVARIEAGRLELKLAAFDPAALLREVAAADAGLAAQKQLTIDVEVAADVPRAVRGDALRVQQILLNLVHNALKFTTHGGIALNLSRDGDGIAYRVADQGPGMTPEECARVFERFEQAGHGRRQRGSGLGLAISRELVALMGGRIEVQSAPGHGSTFSVHLPLPGVAPDTAATPSVPMARTNDPVAATAHTESAGSTPRPRVLLVEDDPIAGQAIGGLMETIGHEVTLVPQALAALAEIDAGKPFDAMVFDFDLPGLDGCELATLLRQRGVVTPIIALTASAHGDEEQRAYAAGMNAFLRKPVLPDDLREALDEAASRRQATATGSP